METMTMVVIMATVMDIKRLMIASMAMVTGTATILLPLIQI